MMALNLNASINDQSIIGHPSLSINLNRISPLDLKKHLESASQKELIFYGDLKQITFKITLNK